MRSIAAYVLGALLLLLVGGWCLGAGLLHRQMARAEQQAVAGGYVESSKILAAVEPYYERASRLPWIGNEQVNEVRAREAAIQYWQRRYGRLAPEGSDPVAAVPADNVDLQFIAANSVFREGIAGARDRASTIGALDAGINAYATVLRHAGRHHDASFNYEYLLRLKDEIEQGRRKAVTAADSESPHGQGGHSPEQADADKYKVYVPHNQEEIDKNDRDATAGKAAPIKRKG